MGAYFALRGYRLKVIAKPLHNPLVEKELTATRRAVGFDILYTREGMKPGLRHLREGGALAILGDQDARRQGIAVPFFGQPASTALGPAVFAWLARVPIVPVFSYRVGPMRHRFRFFPAIEVSREQNREEALAQATRAHVRLLEEFIREHPEDYFWFHRRWKTPARKTRDFGREE
jgi:KDO2-lipid IV(A) lauroyltransferase